MVNVLAIKMQYLTLFSYYVSLIEFYTLTWLVINFFYFLHGLKLIILLIVLWYIRLELLSETFPYLIRQTNNKNQYSLFLINFFFLKKVNLQSNRLLYSQF
jgi:hypothetical protein